MRTDLLNNVGGVDITSTWTSFTPTVNGDGGSGESLGAQAGRYMKIGSTVFFNMYFQIASKGSRTGTFYVYLPKIASGSTNLPQYLNGGILSIGDNPISLGLGVPTINTGAFNLYLTFTNAFGSTNVQRSDIATGDYVTISGFYYSI